MASLIVITVLFVRYLIIFTASCHSIDCVGKGMAPVPKERINYGITEGYRRHRRSERDREVYCGGIPEAGRKGIRDR